MLRHPRSLRFSVSVYRNGASETEIREWIGALELEIVLLDTERGIRPGFCCPPHGRPDCLSADRACLNLAHRLGVRALTTDRAWSEIAAAVQVEIELIR